jgi:hypothetical protein
MRRERDSRLMSGFAIVLEKCRRASSRFTYIGKGRAVKTPTFT